MLKYIPLFFITMILSLSSFASSDPMDYRAGVNLRLADDSNLNDNNIINNNNNTNENTKPSTDINEPESKAFSITAHHYYSKNGSRSGPNGGDYFKTSTDKKTYEPGQEGKD